MSDWKHSIITGGASGLGLGLAQRLLKRGTRVSVLDLSLKDDTAQVLDAAASEGGSEWQYLEANLTDAPGTASAVQQAVDRFGLPDLAINSAGIIHNATVAETSVEDFQRVVNVNLNGSFNFTKAVIPHLREGSRVALIASAAGLVSNYGYVAYGSSKFGVVGLATTLRYEYDPLGVGITCVCPPEVKTPMVATERTPGNANPISLALKDQGGSLEPDEACDAILKGIDEGQWLVIPGLKGRMTVAAARHSPDVFFGFMKRNIKKLMEKHGKPSLG